MSNYITIPGAKISCGECDMTHIVEVEFTYNPKPEQKINCNKYLYL